MPAKQNIHVEGLSRPGAAFSPVIVTPPGRLFFVAGLLARGDSGEIVGQGDAAAQTRQICRNLGKAAQAAGGSLESIVRLDIYVTDIAFKDQVNAVRREVFAVDPPVSTMVQVGQFTESDALVEITAIGVVSG
ncbi:MAG: RidA family protein [Betaproteobacteria bacterium]|nr:RidA family protein [Betaproteobacteria bacterium]